MYFLKMLLVELMLLNVIKTLSQRMIALSDYVFARPATKHILALKHDGTRFKQWR